MADEEQSVPTPMPGSGMFAEPVQEKRFPTTAVAIASVAVVILVVVLILLGRRKGSADEGISTPQAAASYASSLAISNVQMSESESLSGGKVMYIDGHIANHGPSVVNGMTAQVAFANDQGTAPQIMTVPVNLIRMREPYIDTQPVSAAPIAPGAEADFRLIFEGVSESWNNQQPEIKITRVTSR